MVAILPPFSSPLRSQNSYAANHSSSRTYTTGLFKITRDSNCNRGNSQQQVTEQQQQLQQHSQQEQQLLSTHSTNLAPLQAGMAAPYAPDSGKLSVEMPAAAAGLVCWGSAAAGASGHGSSRQGSINSSFFDADSVFEAGCNSRESFLLPEDMEEAPFNSSAALVVGSSAPAAAAGSSCDAKSSNWLSGVATPLGARSPLVCPASTVAALMADAAAPSMELLQLDDDLATPGNNPFSCLNNEDASEQLLSFYEPAAPPTTAPDFVGLFDPPAADSSSPAAANPTEASAGAAVLTTQPHVGMINLNASMAASAALRRGQQDDSSCNSMASSSDQANVTHSLQQQQQPLYTLVLLDGSTGAPLTAAAGARDAEQLSMMIGNSSTTATAATHDALGHGPFGQGYECSGFGASGKKAAAGAAAAVLDNTFSAAAAAGDLPNGCSGRGRPGRPKGSAGRPCKAAAAAKAPAAAPFSAAAGVRMQPSVEVHGMTTVNSAALAASMSVMASGMTSSSSRRSSEAGDSLAQSDPAAAAAMTRSDSGSGGDSSNESATTLQQEDASKCPALHLTVAVAAPAAVSSASKHNQRVFHHKGGGPCDHCGVLGK